MRPVPVPVIARLMHPEGEPLAIAGPSGDLLDETVAPVDALTDIADLDEDTRAACLRLYLRPEGDDLDRLRDGGLIELTLMTRRLPVFQVAVIPGH